MSKSTHFFGQSVFGQLISHIDDDIISDSAKMKGSDYYIKKFKTRDHLVSMLFCAFAKCISLREVSGAMLGLAVKTRIKDVIDKQIEIFDSTTISLFQDILKCVGRNPTSGKRKGGVKVHTVINVDEKAPKMVWITDAATHDHKLLSKLKLDNNTIYVFDKGYNDSSVRFTYLMISTY